MTHHQTKKLFGQKGKLYWLRLISVGIVGGALIALLIIEVFFVFGLTSPVPRDIGSPPESSTENEYIPVSLTSDLDGITISGWYHPSQNSAVIILLHGYGSSRLEMVPHAQILARHGYGVFLYDQRGHGESGGDYRAFGWPDVEDLKAVLNFVRSQEDVDPERIGILGFSMGGQIAIRGTAAYPEIKAIIADDPAFVTMGDLPGAEDLAGRITRMISVITSWGISIRTGNEIPPGVPAALEEISPRPILYIASGTGGGRAQVRHFYQLSEDPKDIWEVPEAFHGGQLQARPLEYEEVMVSFFDDHLSR